MKRKDKTDISALSKEDLIKEIMSDKKHLVELAINRYTKQLKNIREYKLIRKKVALLSTYLRQKEIHNG